jgi:hypothetical protein
MVLGSIDTGGGRMKIRQARKIFRRVWFGRKKKEYFDRIKIKTYWNALGCGAAIVLRKNRKRRKEVGE